MPDDKPSLLYDSVLRMVIWGEEREKVFHMLEVNGVTGHQAEGLYKMARRERIAAISTSLPKNGHVCDVFIERD